MLEIFVDENVRGKNAATDKVYYDGNLTVESGYLSLGSYPIMVLSFERPRARVYGGQPLKDSWEVAKSQGIAPTWALSYLVGLLDGSSMVALLDQEARRAYLMGTTAVQAIVDGALASILHPEQVDFTSRGSGSQATGTKQIYG